MTLSGASGNDSPSEQIDARIAELGDGRAKALRQVRTLIKPALDGFEVRPYGDAELRRLAAPK